MSQYGAISIVQNLFRNLIYFFLKFDWESRMRLVNQKQAVNLFAFHDNFLIVETFCLINK